MRKTLYISNVAQKVGAFSMASISASKANGMEMLIAANWSGTPVELREADGNKYGIKLVQIDLTRSPFSLRNVKALRQLVDFIKNESIDYIHCNTPVGGILGRLAGRKCRVKKVIYQAHGFHFYKGAPLLNWILYYPVEKILARITDEIITINQDDYRLAKKKLHPRGQIHYVPGVGINTDDFAEDPQSRQRIRSEIGASEDDFLVLSVGRLEQNKNVETVIKALSFIENKKIKLVVCGDGELRESLQALAAEKGISDRVFFLGNRSDMKDIYYAVDCFTLASYREGLSRSIMEAMACGLPCVVSKIRGNTDLVDVQGGMLCAPSDCQAYSSAFETLYNDKDLRLSMAEHNHEKIILFGYDKVVEKMTGIYRKMVSE